MSALEAIDSKGISIEAIAILRAYVALFHDLSPGDRALARTVKRNDELIQRVYNLLRTARL